MKGKFKIPTYLCLISGIVLTGSLKVNAMMKKVVTTLGGVSSRLMRVNTAGESIENKSLRLSREGSYSKYVSNKKRDLISRMIEQNQHREIKEQELVGKFKLPKGNVESVKIESSLSEDGLSYNSLKLEDGSNISLLTSDGINYSPGLDSKGLLKLIENNEGLVTKATDKLGRKKYVIVTEGENDLIALQLDLGIYRDVYRDEENNLHLGNKVDLNSLSDDIKNNAKSVLEGVSKYSPSIDIEKSQGYIQPDLKKISKKEIEERLPILTYREIQELKTKGPTNFQSVIDKNGKEKQAIIVGTEEGTILSYLPTEGKFYNVTLNKKKKMVLGTEINEKHLDSKIISNFKILLSDTDKKPELGIPKLSKEQLEEFKSSNSDKVQKLKDINGVEKEVILIGNKDNKELLVSYNPLSGELNKVDKSRKGNYIVKESTDINSLPTDLKNEVEEVFSSLNVGYTKTSKKITEGSQIVSGARRKTRLLTDTSKKEEPKASFKLTYETFIEEADVISKDGKEKLGVYKGYTLDGSEIKFAITKDGRRIKLVDLQEDTYLVNTIDTKEKINKLISDNEGRGFWYLNGINEGVGVYVFKLSTGERIAYEINEGIFRNIVKEKGQFILKSKVDISKLPLVDQEKIKNKVKSLINSFS